MGNEASRPGAAAAGPDERTVKMMDAQMRTKLGKGEKFNMKIVICGESHTGKTCLFNKLQGHPLGEYRPTTSLQSGHVHWSPKRSEDIVKVEVWDVPAIQKAKQGLKMSWNDAVNMKQNKKTAQGSYVIEELVEETQLEVLLKDAQAVLVTINPQDRKSFLFARSKLEHVPATTHVCVLGLFQDKKDQWVVSDDELHSLVADRQHAHFLECSNVTNFGLQVLYTFFELPFLALQKKSLLKRLEINAIESQISEGELSHALKLNHNPVEVLPGEQSPESSEGSESDSGSDESGSDEPKRAPVVKPQPASKAPRKGPSAKAEAKPAARVAPKQPDRPAPAVAAPPAKQPKPAGGIDDFAVGDLDAGFLDSGSDGEGAVVASKPEARPAEESDDDGSPPRRAALAPIPQDEDGEESSEDEQPSKQPAPRSAPEVPASNGRAVAPEPEEDDGDEYEALSEPREHEVPGVGHHDIEQQPLESVEPEEEAGVDDTPPLSTVQLMQRQGELLGHFYGDGEAPSPPAPVDPEPSFGFDDIAPESPKKSRKKDKEGKKTKSKKKSAEAADHGEDAPKKEKRKKKHNKDAEENNDEGHEEEKKKKKKKSKAHAEEEGVEEEPKKAKKKRPVAAPKKKVELTEQDELDMFYNS